MENGILPEGLKLAVVGSRSMRDWELVYSKIEIFNPALIISGGARGADLMAQEWAISRGVPFLIFPPNTDRYGMRAFHIRNAQIVAACDRLLACWDGKSRGDGVDH